jgi:hypothetical protein
MKPHRIAAIIGFAFVTSSPFLPWITTNSISRSGWTIALALSIFFIMGAGLCAGLAFIKNKWVNVFSGLLALTLTLLSFTFLSDTHGYAGSGLYIFALGSIILLIASSMVFFKNNT